MLSHSEKNVFYVCPLLSECSDFDSNQNNSRTIVSIKIEIEISNPMSNSVFRLEDSVLYVFVFNSTWYILLKVQSFFYQAQVLLGMAPLFCIPGRRSSLS